MSAGSAPRAGSLLAQRDVELAVLAKVESSPLVAGRHGSAQLGLIIPFEEYLLTARGGHVPGRREAANSVMRVRLRPDVASIDKRLPWKLGIDRDSKQAPLPAAVHFQPDKRLRQEVPVFHDPKRAGLLADEDPAVRCHFQRRGSRQPGGNRLDREAARQSQRIGDTFARRRFSSVPQILQVGNEIGELLRRNVIGQPFRHEGNFTEAAIVDGGLG